MVVIDGQYSYAIYISISIYIHVNFNCMSEIHIFVVVVVVVVVVIKVEQGRCKTISGEVQNDLRGGAHLPTKSGHGKIHQYIPQ
jgi:hypothetical protein